MTPCAAIRVDGLTKYYGAVIGIEDLSFEVARGEVYGFLGANGAGKTTTIRLLLDLLRPSRGRATVLGVDCQRDSLAARRLIGYLPGELPIYPDLTAARLSRVPVAASTAGRSSHGYLRQLLRALRRQRRRSAAPPARAVARHEAEDRHHPGADGAPAGRRCSTSRRRGSIR